MRQQTLQQVWFPDWLISSSGWFAHFFSSIFQVLYICDDFGRARVVCIVVFVFTNQMKTQ